MPTVRSHVLSLVLLMVAVLAVYANHFHNSFHYDDYHTIVSNPYIRELRFIPRFFTDARTFTVLPRNRTYRPMVSTSLAFDYWLGGNLDTFYFHVSTFFWFLAQLILMYALFRKVCDNAVSDPRNHWVALFATAWYGLHPAMAETVNYIIQRGDLYVTLGVVAALWIYAAETRFRKYGLYLLPFAAAVLSKPPALIFPAILFVYTWLVELNAELRRLPRALARSFPALVVAILLLGLTIRMTPEEFTIGPTPPAAFRLTQPLVALRFFRTFLVPDSLSADTDHGAVASLWRNGNWAGFVFIFLIIAAGIAASRRREWRPAAFGIWFFILAFTPAALFAVPDLENDHRMFFPFVGLSLAVCWPVALWIYRRPETSMFFRRAVPLLCAGQLVICGLAARQRNAIWRTEESLWRDVTLKSRRNPRGHLNYAIALERKRDYSAALAHLNTALTLLPHYSLVETNLGIVESKLQHRESAEQHFRRAVLLDPQDAICRITYADWLEKEARYDEALGILQFALEKHPDVLEGRYLAMRIFGRQKQWTDMITAAEGILSSFPASTDAKAYRLMAALESGAIASLPVESRSAEVFLDLSQLYFTMGQFDQCIAAAEEVLKLRPSYPEAYNNIAAAYSKLEKWEESIEAARAALRIQPDYKPAQENLARAQERKSGPVNR